MKEFAGLICSWFSLVQEKKVESLELRVEAADKRLYCKKLYVVLQNAIQMQYTIMQVTLAAL